MPPASSLKPHAFPNQPCLAWAMAWASSSARCDPIMNFLLSASSRSAPRHGFAGGDQKRAGDFEQQRDGFQNFADDGNERDQSGRDGGVEEVEGGDGDLGETQLLEEAAEAEADEGGLIGRVAGPAPEPGDFSLQEHLGVEQVGLGKGQGRAGPEQAEAFAERGNEVEVVEH